MLLEPDTDDGTAAPPGPPDRSDDSTTSPSFSTDVGSLVRAIGNIDGATMVVVVGALLILVQTAFRAWAALNGWFYGDDYEFLANSTDSPLSLHLLLEPHDSQLMPGGILITWLIAHAGAFNWTLTAIGTVLLQLGASAACLLMLVRLFGRRWMVLVPLSLYLFATLTLTSFMWWAAALNQIPQHLAFFLVVTWHVSYLRTRRTRYVVLAAAALLLGLCFYVKAVLIVVPLVPLTFFWFTPRGRHLVRRALLTVTDAWRLWLAYTILIGGYLAYYTQHVPAPVSADAKVDFGQVADAMLRRSLGTSLVGGPWRWTEQIPPLAWVDAPDWSVTLSWVVLAVIVALLIRSGRGDWRAVWIVVPYLAITFLLTALGRGVVLGALAGLELRYLSDSAPVIALAVGLFLMRPEPDRIGVTAAFRPTRRWIIPGLVVALVGTGFAVSNVTYAQFWGAPFPTKAFHQTAVAASKGAPLRLVDEPVPGLVMPETSFPYNLPSKFFSPLGSRIQGLDQGTDLSMLDDTGTPLPAQVTPGATSVPGPKPPCGYLVREQYVPIQMEGTPKEFFWWAQVSYLASRPGTGVVHIGGRSTEVDIAGGLHDLFIKGSGAIKPLLIRSTTPGLVLCVDHVTIGTVTTESP